jgi:hypothetical protein
MKMARSMADTYDREPWSNGGTIEDAAKHLCRSGTIDDVRRKAEELGLAYERRDGQQQNADHDLHLANGHYHPA